ncbi:MAG: glycosyltransferase family 1 protein [Lentisphaeria bacterium]|nr:glycosyltransferase family 1 protein [Lentisphaeria bacterium]
MIIGICARTWGERGGIGAYTRSIVSALVQIDTRHQYRLFYADPSHVGNFRSAPHVRELHVPARGKWLWDQWAVPRAARREKVDVIFHTKFAIPFLARCRTAMVLHGTERFVYPEHHQRADLWFFKTVYPQYLRRASLILAVSERGRQDIIEKLGIEAHKIKTVHLAANPVFRVLRDRQVLEEARRRYRLPARYIVYVGHIYPGKNIGRLFQALALVRQQHDIDLVIAGAPRWKYKDDLALIPQLKLDGHVHVLGHVPHEELVALYNLAALTAFPSFYESFPAIPLEANACGCPVVISRTGGSPEAAGDAALYVDPPDVPGIAEAITRILTDEGCRQDLIARGFKNAARFSWDKAARETLQALEWVVGEG